MGGALYPEDHKKVKVGEEQPLLDAIAEFTEKLAGSKMSLQRYRILIMELITELSRFGANNQINLEDVFGGNGDVYTRAMQLESTDALREWLCENCLKLQNRCRTSARIRRSPLCRRQSTM